MLEPGHELIGRLLNDRYRLDAVIASSRLSTVYKAKHLILDTYVAIKMMNATALGDEAAVGRFQKEAQSLSQLKHPNIVGVQAFGIEDGLPFLSLDFIEGENLESLVQRQGKLPVDAALKIFEQVLEGLRYAHEHNIVHRDLKPSSIMVGQGASKTSLVKILDFGIARMFDDGKRTQGLAQSGALIGTPVYMSPEQLNAMPVGTRSDIYSLGCIMYFALSGQPPFSGTTSMDLAREKQESQPPSLANISSLSPPVPLELSRLIDRCLSPDPKDRYQNVEDLQSDFREICKCIESGNWPDAPIVRLKKRKRHAKVFSGAPLISRTFLVLALLLITFVAATGGAIWIFAGQSNVPEIREWQLSLLNFCPWADNKTRHALIDEIASLYQHSLSLASDKTIELTEENKERLRRQVQLREEAVDLAYQCYGSKSLVTGWDDLYLSRLLFEQRASFYFKSTDPFIKQGKMLQLQERTRLRSSMYMLDLSERLATELFIDAKTPTAIKDNCRELLFNCYNFRHYLVLDSPSLEAVRAVRELGTATVTIGYPERAIPLYADAIRLFPGILKAPAGMIGRKFISTQTRYSLDSQKELLITCRTLIDQADKAKLIGKAQKVLQNNVKEYEKDLGPNSIYLAELLNVLGDCYLLQHKPELALQCETKAARIVTSLPADAVHRLVVYHTMNSAANSEATLGRFADTIPYLERLHSIDNTDLHDADLMSYIFLAECYRQIKNNEKAFAVLDWVINQVKGQRKPNALQTVAFVETFRRYFLWKKPELATPLAPELFRLVDSTPEAERLTLYASLLATANSCYDSKSFDIAGRLFTRLLAMPVTDKAKMPAVTDAELQTMMSRTLSIADADTAASKYKEALPLYEAWLWHASKMSKVAQSDVYTKISKVYRQLGQTQNSQSAASRAKDLLY
jgi:serine/threonine protein kinase